MTKVGIVERAISDIYGKIQTGFKCIIKNHLKKMNEKKKSKIFPFLFTSIARDGGIWKININHIKQFNWKQWYSKKR